MYWFCILNRFWGKSSGFDVFFCWYWLLFVKSLSFIWTGFWKFCSFRFIKKVWDVFDLNLLCRVSFEEILRFPELGFDCYCEWWCLFGFTQATLGLGTAEGRSILQCNIGNKSPVFLCTLYPVNSESLQVNLEFEEADDVVFSVLGPRSIFLSGYYVSTSQQYPFFG